MNKPISIFGFALVVVNYSSGTAIEPDGYDIEGDKIGSLSPGANAPVDKNGNPVWGQARYSLKRDGTFSGPTTTGPDSNGDYCSTMSITSVTDLYFQDDAVIIPFWPSRNTRCKIEQDAWDGFRDDVEAHEFGHFGVNYSWNGGEIPNGGKGVAHFEAEYEAIVATGNGASTNSSESDCEDNFEDLIQAIDNQCFADVKILHNAYHASPEGGTYSPNTLPKCP
ncbi:MAG: hypothetical protein V2I33_20275 [Kangiellaceae bacterium]|jgi:hypothetical protein|nr:hypothetical protein [Kangiellaceae bacterium]